MVKKYVFLISLKVIIFSINRESLVNYHRTLNDVFEEELMQNEKIRTIMLSSFRKIYMMAYAYYVMMLALFTAYFLPPYLFIIRDLCHFRLTTNYTLPASGGYGYFWAVPDNFLYHFHLFFETIIVALNNTTASSVDTAFGFYVYQFASTMNAMTFKLTNPLSTEKFSDLVRTCVAKHQKLLQCRNTMEHTYQTIIFWHAVTNAMLLCVLIYEVTSVRKCKIRCSML